MAEGIGEDDVAARLGEVDGGVIASLGLGDGPLNDHLIVGQAQRFHHGLRAIVVRGGVAFVFVADKDVADLDLIRGNALCERGGADERHCQNQHQRNDFLHG